MDDAQSPQPEPVRIPPAKVKVDRSKERHNFPVPHIPEKGRVECLHCHEWLPFDRFESLTDPLCYHCRSTISEVELQALKERHNFPVPHIPEKGRVECLHCHEWLPFDRFESLTDPLCYHCRSTISEVELQSLKERMSHDFSKKLAQSFDERGALEHIENFLGELVYNFGGMRAFVKAWSDQLKIAFDKNPGCKTNLDQCRSIAKLVMDCNKLQHQEDVLDLSDEQLRVKKELALMQMLTDAAGDPHRRQMLAALIRTGGMNVADVPGLPDYMEAEHAN